MRLATHATSCDSDTRFTIFFMFATSSCTSSTMHVHCTCTQGRNCTPGYFICVCRVSHVAKVELSSTTGALRQLATAHNWQFLVATVANRVSSRRKLYCESALRHWRLKTPWIRSIASNFGICLVSSTLVSC